MQYEIVNLETWERKNAFRHFMERVRNVVGITAEIDVTALLRFAKANGLKFYPTMIWVVSTVVNRHAEFKYGWDEEGRLIRWERIAPYYTDFRAKEEEFVLLWTEYTENFRAFYRKVEEDRAKALARGREEFGGAPGNVFNISALPWLKYQSLDIHVFDEGKYLAPVITWGKYTEQNGKIIMPLSIQMHHAVCDGYHLCRFFNEVQEVADALGQEA